VEQGSGNRILRVVAILDEKALGDVIGSFREKRSLSLSVWYNETALGLAAAREVIEVIRRTV
jgi:hypothetical protein